MKQFFQLIFVFVIFGDAAFGQQPATTTRPTTPTPQRQATTFEVSEYGVEFQADPRVNRSNGSSRSGGFRSTPPGRQPRLSAL